MYHVFFIHSSVNGHLGCFHVLVTVNSAAINIGVHVCFWIMVFSSCMSRSEIAGSYSSSISVFFREPQYCSPQRLYYVCRFFWWLPFEQDPWVRSLGQEDPLEEGMATHSSFLAWEIPWTGEPGRLQSTGSQRIRHNWSDWAPTYEVILWFWFAFLWWVGMLCIFSCFCWSLLYLL